MAYLARNTPARRRRTDQSHRVIRCSECEAPWGYVLGRHEKPSAAAEALALDAIGRVSDGRRFDGRLRTARIVFVTEASAAWLCECLGWERALPDVWQETGDLPAWWAARRSPRWAYRTHDDGCTISKEF